MKSKYIVFVRGLFGWGSGELGGLPYWGDALAQFEGVFKTHWAKCGPISSFHDRACELIGTLYVSKRQGIMAAPEQPRRRSAAKLLLTVKWLFRVTLI
jgi:hypothetical protein